MLLAGVVLRRAARQNRAMPERLYSLTYLSRLRMADSRAALRASVLNILESSRANNRVLGITGVLLFSGVGFAQVLEGRNPDIERVFARIRADHRHQDVTVINEQAISERSFGEWHMAYVQAPETGDANLFEPAIAGTVSLERVGTTLEAQRIIATLRTRMAAVLAGGPVDRLPEELSGL